MKLKTCSKCSKEKPIWKNHEGNKYCQSCWSKVGKQKPINKKSEKQVALDKAYSLLRKEYLGKHPICEMQLPGVCTNVATDIHHTEYRGIQTLVTATWKACCRGCHDFCHSHPIEARELGFLK